MVIKQKIGNLSSFDIAGRSLDFVLIEWYEADKRIMHKRSRQGREVVIKFMGEAQSLTEGDVLSQDREWVIAVEIEPCEAIIICPSSLYEMASVCYEIGNKHLPLFYVEDKILAPFDEPLFKLLTAAGYKPERAMTKLVDRLKTTVAPHAITQSKQSLFSKILQLTTPSADA